MSDDAGARNQKHYAMPFTRVEVAVLGLREGRLHALLVRRAEAPFAGRWALPGGVIRIDLDSSLEATARRVLRERLGFDAVNLKQLSAAGGPTRDPRAPWALSIVYRAFVSVDRVYPITGKRVEEVAWWPVDDVPASVELAFDHSALLAQAAAALRAEVAHLEFSGVLVPVRFTLGELQVMCEQLLGHRIDKSSFRRKLADRAIVEPIDGETRSGANRPAQVYRLCSPLL